jgi:hypothetical protein
MEAKFVQYESWVRDVLIYGEEPKETVIYSEDREIDEKTLDTKDAVEFILWYD